MSISEESMDFIAYFKIPYTEITTTHLVKKSLTMNKFVDFVNTNIRNALNINGNYVIEIVDVNKPGCELAMQIQTINNETLLQRYGDSNQSIAFYVRPVYPNTREFVRRHDYSIY